MTKISLEEFEEQFKRLVPSVDRFMMRPGGNNFLVTVRNVRDFYSAVRAASSVNIALETGWLFGSRVGARSQRGIRSCFLIFRLTNACDDERLFYLIKELELDAERQSIRRG